MIEVLFILSLYLCSEKKKSILSWLPDSFWILDDDTFCLLVFFFVFSFSDFGWMSGFFSTAWSISLWTKDISEDISILFKTWCRCQCGVISDQLFGLYVLMMQWCTNHIWILPEYVLFSSFWLFFGCVWKNS